MGVNSNASFIQLLRVIEMLIEILSLLNDNDMIKRRQIQNDFENIQEEQKVDAQSCSDNEDTHQNHKIVNIEVGFTGIQLDTNIDNLTQLHQLQQQFVQQNLNKDESLDLQISNFQQFYHQVHKQINFKFIVDLPEEFWQDPLYNYIFKVTKLFKDLSNSNAKLIIGQDPGDFQFNSLTIQKL
eukprot:403365363